MTKKKGDYTLKVDTLVVEFGSTLTKVNAFDGTRSAKKPGLVGQGFAETTVDQGDITIGFENAIEDLRQKVGEHITWGEMFACSSAAGGLRVSVHGLVYDMTVKAAKEAALGAGAVVKMITAGMMRAGELQRLKSVSPNIIILAGGVDYGERVTVIHNAKAIASAGLNVPVIYAGNSEARLEVVDILRNAGIKVFAVENVYPSIDILNIEPTRKAIQKAFEQHIIKAPGMEGISEIVEEGILPVPGAVMTAAEGLREIMGDLVVVDIGGATTDVHSVVEAREEIERISFAPEPFSKRTVEGDLGVYINAPNVLERLDLKQIQQITHQDPWKVLMDLGPVPFHAIQVELVRSLAENAALEAISRHAGSLRTVHSGFGHYKIAEGKDLGSAKYLVGTGGVLTRLSGAKQILAKLTIPGPGRELYPCSARIIIDSCYIMASTGVLYRRYPEAAMKILRMSLEGGEVDETRWNDIGGTFPTSPNSDTGSRGRSGFKVQADL